MRKGTLKSITSLALVIFLLIPNIASAAVEVNNHLGVRVEDVSKNEISKPNNENGETSGDINSDMVKPEVEATKPEGEGVKPNDDIIEENKENVGSEEQVDIVKPEIDNKESEKAVNDAVQNAAKKEAEKETKKSISGETYAVTQKPQTFSSESKAINPLDYEREEVRGRIEAISELEYLVPKTAANYELAIAYSDGSYSYVESVDTIEEAIKKAKEMPLPASEDTVLPAVINNEGQVVYSTSTMLRILSKDKSTINMYPTSSLTKAFTYISQDYVDDAPIFEDNGAAARVEVSGYSGWIDKSTSSEVIPVNQVINPSYYVSRGGVLYHFISYDLRSSTNKGYELKLGPAPSYLSEGVKYLSYDGNYFYNGSDISAGLNRIISDLKNGHHNNSINASNPHYLYFNYLPFRSATSYTANELNRFINDNTEASSKLRGIGQALIDAQNAYGVNAVLTLSVAINESGWGMSSISQNKNNLFGIKAYDSSPGQSADSFNTPGDSVIEFAKNYISRGYADPADWRYNGGFLGGKNRGANVKYASDPFWGEKAAQWAYRIDSYLSSANSLKDQDAYQLAMYKSDNQVKNSSGTLLYNITSDLGQYAGYYDTTLVLTKTATTSIGGADCYEMYPERNTPVYNGGTDNKFSGNYNWRDKGYVKTSGIKFLNKGKNSVLPNDPAYVNAWMQSANGTWYYYDSNSNLVKGWLNLKGTYYFLDRSTGAMKTGWVKDKNEWYYLDDQGKMLTGLVTINSDKYLLDGSGKMLTGWQQLSGVWYYFEGNGVMAKGWRQIGSSWYYLNETTGKMATDWLNLNGKWYYLNASGVRQTGWLQTGSGKYYLEGSGVMAVGWKLMNGKWYYFNPNNGAMATGKIEVDGAIYHIDASGVMYSNGWFSTSTGWYYLEANGTSAVGWKKVGPTWYYFNSTGVMQTGWINVDKHTYYLDAGGGMKTGWLMTQSGSWYYLEGSGEMAKGWKMLGGTWYYLNTDSGVMAKGLVEIAGDKYFMENSGAMITNWKEINGKWYYFQVNGVAVKSAWLTTSYSYYFDKDSVMLTGWQTINGNKYYLYPQNGRMAQNVTIDGIFIGNDGIAKN